MEHILIRPLLTEKVLGQTEKQNQYAFKVHPEADKTSIKAEIEKRFDVKVKSVRTVSYMGKTKSQFTRKGVRAGKRPDWKKAFVTLVKDNKIDYYANQPKQDDAN